MKLFGLNINSHLRDKVGFFLSTNSVSKNLFGQNRSIIFNRSVTRQLAKYYNGDKGHQTNLTTGNLGYGFIHYSLILNLKPKRVLCVGSRKGFIPAICALACQENGFGDVDFVDAGFGPDDPNNWSGIGWWKEVNPNKHFSFLDVKKNLTTHVMTTSEFAKRYKHKYQYIYIDGDHSYEGVKRDYSLFWPRLDKGGFMAFHDVVARGYLDKGLFGIWRFWREIEYKHTFIFPFPKDSGLGIIQK
ncbi:class I SAM-dependent methyltransferase [Patescibacteria group bacterium]|nr:class I SAM-dependent methyltransferase [Patescibacteria group bacterium]